MTIWPAHMNDVPGADSVVVGEGERTLAELASALEIGAEWRNVPGLAYRDDRRSNVQLSQPRALLPSSTWASILDRDIYSRVVQRARFAYVATSRGCPSNCSYCSVNRFYSKCSGSKWRAREPEDVLAEVEHLVDHYGVRQCTFVDDNYIPTHQGRERALRIAEGMIAVALPLSYSVELRIGALDDDLVRVLAASGVNCVYFGLESVTSRQQHLYRKPVDVREVKETVERCVEHGIHPSLFTMFFDPWVSEEELKASLRFALEVGVEYFHDITNYLFPIKGTDVYTVLERAGMIVAQYRIVPGSAYYLNTRFERPHIVEQLRECITRRETLEKGFISQGESGDGEPAMERYRALKRAVFQECWDIIGSD